MKKSVIIAIFIIYILAIVTVGFVGIAAKAYEEVINVSEIVCLNENYKINTGTGDYDIQIDLPQGEKSITLICEARPTDASKKELDYYANKDQVTLIKNSDGSCTVNFDDDLAYVTITVKATDRPKGATLKIRIKGNINIF